MLNSHSHLYTLLENNDHLEFHFDINFYSS